MRDIAVSWLRHNYPDILKDIKSVLGMSYVIYKIMLRIFFPCILLFGSLERVSIRYF